MRKKGFFLRHMAVCLLCLFLAAGFLESAAEAAPQPQQPVSMEQVFLDHYEVSDGKIVPGGDFTLTLFLENKDEKNDGHVIVDVMYPQGVMPVYGAISQAIVDVPAGGNAEVKLDYIAMDKLAIPVLDFQVFLRENEQQYMTLLRLPLGSSSPFEAITTFVPARAMVGENVNCSMTFKYLGTEAANRINVRMDVDGERLSKIEIGTLAKDTTKTQSISAVFDEPGKYLVELYLDYVDDAGLRQSIQLGSSVVEVEENNRFPESVKQEGKESGETEKSGFAESLDHPRFLAACGGLIVLCLLAIVLVLRKKQ